MKDWKALLSVATTAAVVLAGLVAPTAASAAPGGTVGDPAPTARTVKALPGVQVLTPGATTQITLTGKANNGVESVIVCYVSNWGPARVGAGVRFELFISCQGGAPAQMTAHMDMFWVYLGEFQQVPGSANFCAESNFASLACSSIGPCFQAGNYYDGLADLFAIDELGVAHSATVYAPPRFISCTV